jgi:hypothetical protein
MGSWQRLDLAVTDAAGRRIWGLEHLSRRGKEEITAATCLGVGIWQVRAETDTGLTGTATIHVADVTIAPAPVVVELR